MFEMYFQKVIPPTEQGKLEIDFSGDAPVFSGPSELVGKAEKLWSEFERRFRVVG